MKNGKAMVRGVRSGRLFNVLLRVVKQSELCESNVAEPQSLQMWHERLGHQNKQHVKRFLKKRGVNVLDDNVFCAACVQGKQQRSSFKSRKQRATTQGEIIHADLCGPMEVNSLGEAKYFMCFTCDFTRYRIVVFLKEKSEAAAKIDEIVRVVSNLCCRSVKALQCDGGLEFNNSKVKSILKAQGIQLVITNPYTPEQNGCAERTNRTVVDLARTMMMARNMPKFLWAEAVSTAVYVLNRTGPSQVVGKSPYEAFMGKHARIEKLHAFGATCYVHVPKEKRKKWDSKGQRGTFVGYSDDIDGYRVYIPVNRKIIRSKSVIFEPEKLGTALTPFPVDTEQETVEEVEAQSDSESIDDQCVDDMTLKNKGSTVHKESLYETTKSSPLKLRDRATLTAPDRLAYAMLTEIREPISYQKAITSTEAQKWKEAMKEEMKSLEENLTWSLVKLPKDRRTISNRWVFQIKRGPDGAVQRYKARLVCRGFSQKEGVDFNETFSPVARFDTIRAVLSVAVSENLELAQFDVKTAFLNGLLEEEIYMDQPEGFQDDTDRVCKLEKSLYGLKQSPRCWNKRFKKVLLRFGLCESEADPCLYYRKEKGRKLLVVLYVDDGLIAASREEDVDALLQCLRENFKITHEPLGYFLNVNIARRRDGSIFINQKLYAEEVLQRFHMAEASSVSTPIMQYLEASEVEDAKPTSAPYREAIGCLMYLAVATRPDLAFSVNYASRFLEQPSEQQWTLVKRIFRYLKGSTDKGIVYKTGEAGVLHVYSDADYASDPATRRSVSGMVSLYSGGAVSWASQRQKCVSLSTTQAEYIAASEAAKEVVWLSRLYNEIAVLKSVPTLFVDNASAIKLVKNPEFHKRSKHIDVRYYFIRERVNENQLAIEFIGSEFQAADVFTKPMSRVKFDRLCALIGMKTSERMNE